ncbi:MULTISPECIES: DUF2243 domain-containing protein [unclassified Microbacterium]|uniref:DUF2243 domain-containing protein n=1 Tax=unclassified Microbacterium TaxID=2609290 RepID=UPI00214BCCB2|nr:MULTISPECIES: DUF2243 domain-containing protein [unclassified Microbacterium]MCR2808698.1 DUF2243 domain-containing protein [Microbacterium sp. zg.B185]WIM18870.1 DUF2243 domain-containing protein [Microbacterium sp. zg-B185]
MSIPGNAGSSAGDAAAVRDRARAAMSGRNLISGILFGVGLVAFVDEAVFHQILHWHHFYDRGTPALGLVSDGLFHALSWGATIGGLFLLADLRRRDAFRQARWWGGVLLGAGGFQLYDGIVQHKLFGLHQIRYVPDLLLYDMVWNVIAALLVVAGIVVTVRTRPRAGRVE